MVYDAQSRTSAPTPPSRFSISAGQFREKAIGNTFWESGSLNKRLYRIVGIGDRRDLPNREGRLSGKTGYDSAASLDRTTNRVRFIPMTARRCIGVFLLVASLGVVTIQLWVPAFIYRPTALIRSDPRSWGLGKAMAMRVPYRDGTTITGWWSPPARVDAPVVLLVHGRSANISSRLSVVQHLAAQGMGVLLFDYRGYGASTGRPSEQHLLQDTLAAYSWLRRQGVPADRVVVVGQSLGNSPATILAAQRPIGALVLVSPFTSLPDALAERLPWFPVQ